MQVPWSSQFGEDAWLCEHLFHNKRGGFYLEMGAMDGVKLSNSRWFYQAAGWRGMLIEACPSEFGVASRWSPAEHACICPLHQLALLSLPT